MEPLRSPLRLRNTRREVRHTLGRDGKIFAPGTKSQAFLLPSLSRVESGRTRVTRITRSPCCDRSRNPQGLHGSVFRIVSQTCQRMRQSQETRPSRGCQDPGIARCTWRQPASSNYTHSRSLHENYELSARDITDLHFSVCGVRGRSRRHSGK